ncbi:hypothetical protein [Yinghuangia seranimata]|uniref:hypothetical protein n=1 Tax=Yinghuangia seranimata TaxID=408067 RepID=UPI00248AEB1E|nr:hypothetical protein [Yinghuangia seranimata]MDI2128661.1 hypothetical protein [Yinghuangia seranimata]
MKAAGLRAFVAVGVLLALYVALSLPFVVAALFIGLLVGGTDLFASGQAVIVAELVIVLVALVIEVAGPRRLPAGVSVGPRDQPRLWALVRATARELNVPEPDGIVLTGGTAVGVRAVRRPGITLHKHLVLGSAVPGALTEPQLRAVIACALAGLRRRRPPLPDQLALHGLDMVAGLAESARYRSALGDAAAAFAERYESICAPVVDLQERVQDRYAANVYGTDAVADGLDALRRVRTAWGWYRRGYLSAGLASGCVSADPLGDFKALLADPVRAAALAELPPGEPPHPLAARADRLRRRPLDGTLPLRGGEAGIALGLDDPRRVSAHLHAYLIATDDEGLAASGAFEVLDGMTSLDREAFLRQVSGYRAAYRGSRIAPAARQAGAELPVTLGGVLGLLVEGRGETLSREYANRNAHRRPASAATDAGGPDAVDPAVTALAALLACAWVDSGRARWKLTWSGHDEVTAHDGTPLDLPGLAARALAGPEGARELRTAITSAGVSLYYEAKLPVSFAAATERETAVGHR